MRKKILLTLMIFLLCQNIFGQSPKTDILKIRPLNTLFLQNMNLEFEHIFGQRLSIEVQGLWKRKKWFNNGGFESRGGFYRSKGFELGIAPKIYFKKKSPNGFYSALNFTYNYYLFDNFEQNLGVQTSEFRVLDIKEKGPELGIYLGWQKVFANKMTTEICFGVGKYNRDYKEILISGDSYGFNNGIISKNNSWTTAHLNFTIGYCFKKRK